MSNFTVSTNTHSIDSRKKVRDDIQSQIEAFLKKGGEIEKCSSPFDKNRDPKCRLGDEMGFFV